MDWDVFISHAWEDKEDIARPLAKALRRKGLRVWYDEFTLTLGDSLRRSIDRGLAQSRYGVVILSPNFFAKEWPQRELDGLVAREDGSGKVILPILHNVTWEDVRRFSPMLAGKLAVSTAKGLEAVVEEILRALGADGKPPPPPPLAPKKRKIKITIAIIGVIGLLIALGAWLVPNAVDRLFKTPTVTPTIPLGMVYVPAGAFIMGSDDGESDEQPVHTVYLDAFYIDKTEVTNAQFAQFLNEQGNDEEGGVAWLAIGDEDCLISQSGRQYHAKSGYEDHPVIKVSWYGARAYCRWASKRLPTEAEWEKAARGTDGRTYPWGEGLDCLHAQYAGCGGTTMPVGSKPKDANPYGALDMAGNVQEWVVDWYDSDYYSQSPGRNPPGPDSGENRVLRGGSWRSTRRGARCTFRSWNLPWIRLPTVGFRCAKDTE